MVCGIAEVAAVEHGGAVEEVDRELGAERPLDREIRPFGVEIPRQLLVQHVEVALFREQPLLALLQVWCNSILYRPPGDHT
jgi:hypothetical protein